MTHVTRYLQNSKNKEWIAYDQSEFLMLAANLISEGSWSPQHAAWNMQGVALRIRYNSARKLTSVILRVANSAPIEDFVNDNIQVFSKVLLRKQLKSGAWTQLPEVSPVSADPLS